MFVCVCVPGRVWMLKHAGACICELQANLYPCARECEIVRMWTCKRACVHVHVFSRVHAMRICGHASERACMYMFFHACMQCA